MKSKTEITRRQKKKTNNELVEAIEIAKKNNLLEIASALSGSTRNQAKINLDELEKAEGDVLIVVGKILGNGEFKKKSKIYALGFSTKAQEKLKKSGNVFGTILDELRKNPKLKGVILK